MGGPEPEGIACLSFLKRAFLPWVIRIYQMPPRKAGDNFDGEGVARMFCYVTRADTESPLSVLLLFSCCPCLRFCRIAVRSCVIKWIAF